ncbi:MAG: efflux RND transporter periplasmic adaptor subunit [Alphaproteobacteria bacterium]|nr:efflux RND transporter periplasmic adaptor subunit [Alphaproteobacteria bacterium]
MELRANFKVAALLSALALVAPLGACGGSEAGGQAGGARPAPEVGVVVVEPQSVERTVQLAGRISPFLISEVRPQVGGIVRSRLFVEGSTVKAGQVLYEIEPAPYQAAVASAEAALAKAEAASADAQAKLRRSERLLATKNISQQSYDEAKANAAEARADIAAQKAALDAARINLGFTKVTAPIDGVIGISAVTPGALATAEQAEPFAVIQQLDRVYVDLTQSNSQLLSLRRALADKSAGGRAKVRLILEDGSAYEEEGELSFTDVTVDQGTGTVALRAVIPNPDRLLLSGMFVQAIVSQGKDPAAILVPQQGVTRNARGEAVAMVLNKEDVVEARIIETAQAIGSKWLVTEGLAAGDRLIVEGTQKIAPGAPARPMVVDLSALTSGSEGG